MAVLPTGKATRKLPGQVEK